MDTFQHFCFPTFQPPPPQDRPVEVYTYEQLQKLIPNLPLQQPPPPTEHIEDEPIERPKTDLIDIPPEELAKWIEARKRNFPSRDNKARKALNAKERVDRGAPPALSLSKLEIKLRKRLALMRSAFRHVEERRGGNPFLKYLHLHKKLLTNQVLQEHTVLLQCFRYVVKNHFFQTEEGSQS